MTVISCNRKQGAGVLPAGVLPARCGCDSEQKDLQFTVKAVPVLRIIFMKNMIRSHDHEVFSLVIDQSISSLIDRSDFVSLLLIARLLKSSRFPADRLISECVWLRVYSARVCVSVPSSPCVSSA